MTRTILALAALSLTLPAAPAAAQTWTIDTAHSQAGFSVKHMMVSTVRGEFGKTAGTVEYDGTNLSSLKVNATIDATTITTREPKRDEHLKSPDFFDVAKHPKMTFVSKSAKAAGKGKLKVTGDLTIRGVTKPGALTITTQFRGTFREDANEQVRFLTSIRAGQR